MVQLLIVLLALVLVVVPLWAIVRILQLGRQNDALAERLAELESDLWRLRNPANAPPTSSLTTPATPALLPPPPAVAMTSTPAPEAAAGPVAPAPPPLVESAPRRVQTPPSDAPPPPIPRQPEPARWQLPAIDWEQFMGAKLFAWAGGLAAFLGAAFFVKYSFEHDLIPPAVRVALGYLFALALIVGGLKLPRGRYAVTVQTLCGTGIVSLYAVTFACNSFYHFAFFGPVATFALMSLITATAFLLAVRLEAPAVAILGLLGGFLTPVLLSTGRDQPAGLFGYIALLDLGLIAVALRRRWPYLVALGALGTIAMQLGWAARFLSADRAPVAMVICAGFSVLFLAAWFVAHRRAPAGARPPDGGEPGNVSAGANPLITTSAIALPFVALGFGAAFLQYAAISARPGLLFSFVLVADLCLLAIAWFEPRRPRLQLAAGFAAFALLAAWTATRLTGDLLPWALAFSLGYAALHSAFPLVLERRHPETAPTWWSQLFPPLALALLLLPLLQAGPVSWLLWPGVLLIDLLAIALAVITGSLVVVSAVLLLTLGATALWLFRLPPSLDAAPGFLLILGGFSVLFFAAGLFLAGRFGAGGAAPERGEVFRDPRRQIPALSTLLPFLLLILMTQRLALRDPSAIFGLGLLLVVLTLGLAALLMGAIGRGAPGEANANPPAGGTLLRSNAGWLPAGALAGIAALQFAWHARHFDPSAATGPLLWHLGLAIGFALSPFLLARRLLPTPGPWVVAALAPVVHFPLAYRTIDRAWPNEILGALPALFALVPLASLVAILRLEPLNTPARLNRLAWFGGVALLFITLIFPIQFERQWITLGWALEGVALLRLFRRVPHPGLRATAVVLLIAAFVRLALNPAVLRYHAATGVPLLNWYLYTYGITTLCLLAGAALVQRTHPSPPGGRVLGLNAPAVLNTLGTVLAFLLLNLQIADFFAAPGQRVLTFQFSGNLGRDMTYTIGWALFALALLLVGIAKRLRPARYAALLLLGVSLLKLFLHDLARLEALYRIGALFAVAAIAILASAAYQRFLPADERSSKR